MTVVTTICFRAGHAAQAYEEDGTAALSPIPLFAVEPSRGTLGHRSPAKTRFTLSAHVSSASSAGARRAVSEMSGHRAQRESAEL